jgi:hypothetical protein
MSNVNIKTFCELQGCDNYTTFAICKVQRDLEMLKSYDEWYEIYSKEFTLGDKIEFEKETQK